VRRLRIEHAPTTLSGDVLLLSVLTVVLLGVGLGAITVVDTVRGSSDGAVERSVGRDGRTSCAGRRGPTPRTVR
jgi:hypothetical protein